MLRRCRPGHCINRFGRARRGSQQIGSVPGVKLGAVLKGPIVMVADEVAYLDFSQAHFGDVISVNDDVLQRAGFSQATDPQNAQGEDKAKQTHDPARRLRLAKGKEELRFIAVR